MKLCKRNFNLVNSSILVHLEFISPSGVGLAPVSALLHQLERPGDGVRARRDRDTTEAARAGPLGDDDAAVDPTRRQGLDQVLPQVPLGEEVAGTHDSHLRP